MANDYRISHDELFAKAKAAYAAINGTRMEAQNIPQLPDRDLLRVTTVTRYLWDMCVWVLEQRGMLSICDRCGEPSVPYASDHYVPNLFNRPSEEDDASPSPQTHLIGIEEGIERAARYIEKQRDDYVQEFGNYDPSTGATEFSTAGEEHLSTLEELIEGIRSLHETPTPPGNQIRTAECDGKDAVPVTGQLPVGTASPAPLTHVSAPEAAVEEAAKLLCKWIGYAWDGAGERDLEGSFPDWVHNSFGGLSLQGGKPALRRIAAQMLACVPSPQAHATESVNEAFPGAVGFGASFNRELDAWVIYTMPTCARIGQIDGYAPKKIELVLNALRATINPSPETHVKGSDDAKAKLELWFFRDMFESNRLALFSLFGFKPADMDTMAKQRLVFRSILEALATEGDINVNEAGSKAETPATRCTFDPNNDPKNENITSPQPKNPDEVAR